MSARRVAAYESMPAMWCEKSATLPRTPAMFRHKAAAAGSQLGLTSLKKPQSLPCSWDWDLLEILGLHVGFWEKEK